ncbi:MAG: hypothetical protein AB7I36_19100 [Rhodospirillaceae bacterium]
MGNTLPATDDNHRYGLLATATLAGLILDSTFIASQIVPMLALAVRDAWRSIDPNHAAVLQEFLESNFTTAVIGAFAGAWGGAHAAQRLLERADKRKSLERQVQQASLAVSLSYTVFNGLFNMKRQLVGPMKTNYDVAQNFHLMGPNPTCPTPPQINLSTYDVVEVPIERLSRVVTEELLVVGRPLVMVPNLAHSLRDLAGSIQDRNAIVKDFKRRYLMTGPPPHLLFGLPIGSVVDRSYPNAIEAICETTDNALYFSYRITLDLMRYGRNRVDEYEALFKTRPRVTSVDFSTLEHPEDIPDGARFESWDKNFPQEPGDPRVL